MLNAQGDVIAQTQDVSGKGVSLLTDDNQHVCGMRGFDTNTAPNGPFGQILFTMNFGSPARDVARFPLENIGQVGYEASSCSFKSTRALVVQTAVMWPTGWWLVRLTDGAVLREHTVAAEYLSSIVGSEDTGYLAENASVSEPRAGIASAPYTAIRRTSDGAEVGRLTEYAVRSFSGDDTLVLALGKTDIYATRPARVIEWQTGRVLWTGPDGYQLNEVRVLPGGRDFALAFSAPNKLVPPGCGHSSGNPCGGVVDPLRDILIVHGDGSVTRVPGRYYPLWGPA